MTHTTNTPHFTKYGYLSIPRHTLQQMIDTKQDIEVEGIAFSWELLQKNITYNEHRDFVRWDRPDWKRSQLDWTKK